MGKNLGVQDWEKVIFNRACGMSNAKNAQDIGCSATSVQVILNAFDATKDRDWTRCCNTIVTYDATIELFQWAAKKTGTTVPPVVQQAYDKWLDERRQKRLQEVKKQEEANKPAPPSQDEMNTVKAIMMLMQAVNKQNELIESLMDVVIPKYVGDLKDNLNANSDVIHQSVKSCEDKLEAVKIGLRKRGM